MYESQHMPVISGATLWSGQDWSVSESLGFAVPDLEQCTPQCQRAKASSRMQESRTATTYACGEVSDSP